jgi:hemerythrin
MARINKVDVGPGIVWIEVPEAGWRILCGCPADAVKYLKRANLILEVDIDRRRAETGPNAILLSDVMLQNGSFCNLAEFPVLQMLYRQGMILPGHPNNIGERPLLIGNARQVDAQLHYIHRGNYGLLDYDELTATGIDDRLIDEILAFKKCFAFGHIRPPTELLDTALLEEQEIVLRGGLYLRRLALNLFEFRIGDETLAVDLRLAPGQSYEPPYDLPASCTGRDYFSVIHSGDGNGWDPLRPSMGSILCYQGRVYLIDAGPNVHYTLDALGIGVNEIVGLFHTHCHDDHFAGLTTLLRADHRLKYFATPLVRASVTKKLSALMAIDEAMFADCFDVHDLVYDQWNGINGLDVMPLMSPHPVETSIFLFRALAQDGYRSYAHWADIVAKDVLHGMVEIAVDGKGKGKAGISQGFFDRVMADYQRPADLKKIDIGGGLIHGVAEDFNGDVSGRLLLSHLERPLSEVERQIGRTSLFGSVDVLIASDQDYDLRDAFKYLRDYFPLAPQAELATLLNCPLRIDPPGTILLDVNENITSLPLIVSGTVERISADGVLCGGLSAGSLIGEVAALSGRVDSYGYRCRSYVKSLLIPVAMMREFLQRNHLQRSLIARAEARSFLRSTDICAEPLAKTTLTRLAHALTRQNFTAQQIVKPADRLGLVASGSVSLSVGDKVIENLTAGKVFNEERAMFAQTARTVARTEEASEICFLPAKAIRQVPLLRWTLLEILDRRNVADSISISR